MLVRKLIKPAIFIVLSVFFTNTTYAQVSSTVTSIGIDAKVIAPITIENTGSTPLDFGTVSRSSAAGTVTVPTSGNRTSTGGVSVLSSSSYSPAPFTVTGENYAAFNIALPANGTVEMTRSGGSEKMPVNAFLSSVGTSSTLSNTGTASFVVGATLTVGANQVAGDYSGSFSVTVAYQ